MPDTPYDYRQYDRIWRRVNPQEVPYPKVRQEETPPAAEVKPDEVNAILREELRHARELLKLLENSLA